MTVLIILTMAVLMMTMLGREGTEHGFPTSIVFKENPGGEFRKSYHGYPSGKFLQVVMLVSWARLTRTPQALPS